MGLSERSVSTLRAVAADLPGGGEDRAGQVEMTSAVAEAMSTDRHLIAEAGTGTGKSLAYLVPAVSNVKGTVLATATKGLQDQLAN